MNNWCDNLCGSLCDSTALPAISDPACVGTQDLNFGGFSKLLLTNGAEIVEWDATTTACLADVSAIQAAFDARISPDSTDIEAIRCLCGTGGWEVAQGDKVIICGYEGLPCEESVRKPSTYTVTFTVSKTNCTNYEWTRAMSCVGAKPKFMWLGDCNGNVFGGSGISLSDFTAVLTMPTDNSLQTISITASFIATCLPQRLSGLSLCN